jgi:hypothetical protein
MAGREEEVAAARRERWLGLGGDGVAEEMTINYNLIP